MKKSLTNKVFSHIDFVSCGGGKIWRIEKGLRIRERLGFEEFIS